MAAKIYLQQTDDLEGASIIVPRKGLPAFHGKEDENLACSACKEVVGRNISTASVYSSFKVDRALVLRCPCGVHLLLPAIKA